MSWCTTFSGALSLRRKNVCIKRERRTSSPRDNLPLSVLEREERSFPSLDRPRFRHCILPHSTFYACKSSHSESSEREEGTHAVHCRQRTHITWEDETSVLLRKRRVGKGERENCQSISQWKEKRAIHRNWLTGRFRRLLSRLGFPTFRLVVSLIQPLSRFKCHHHRNANDFNEFLWKDAIIQTSIGQKNLIIIVMILPPRSLFRHKLWRDWHSRDFNEGVERGR